eukprot:tig00020553_g10613.t1
MPWRLQAAQAPAPSHSLEHGELHEHSRPHASRWRHGAARAALLRFTLVLVGHVALRVRAQLAAAHRQVRTACLRLKSGEAIGGRRLGGLLWRLTGLSVYIPVPRFTLLRVHWTTPVTLYAFIYLARAHREAAETAAMERGQHVRFLFGDREILLGGLLILCSVFVHEAAHGIAFRFYGHKVDEICVHVIGGYAKGARSNVITEPQNAVIAAAGPAASVAFGCLLQRLAPHIAVDPRTAALLAGAAWGNVTTGALNMLPMYPLDGGRVTRALLRLTMSDEGAADGATALVSLFVAGGFTTAALRFGDFSAPLTVLFVLAEAFGELLLDRTRAAAEATHQELWEFGAEYASAGRDGDAESWAEALEEASRAGHGGPSPPEPPECGHELGGPFDADAPLRFPLCACACSHRTPDVDLEAGPPSSPLPPPSPAKAKAAAAGGAGAGGRGLAALRALGRLFAAGGGGARGAAPNDLRSRHPRRGL